jgi:protein-disulfide isomerase
MWRAADRIMIAGAIILVTVVGYKESGLKENVRAWKEAQHRRHVLVRLWPQVVSVAQPLGHTGKRLAVIECGDYECPFCRRSDAALSEWLSTDGHALLYVNMPLGSHPHARNAAAASLCAEQQGRFPEMHEQLLRSSQWLADGDVMREARIAGVKDTSSFAQCLASQATGSQIEAGLALAESLEVSGTPTFFTERSMHVGIITKAGLDSLVSDL